MAKPFKKIHACIVGKFENGIGEKIPQWIRANGGQFSRDVDARVTHLIATKEAFKQNAVLGIMFQLFLQTLKLINSIQSKMPSR